MTNQARSTRIGALAALALGAAALLLYVRTLVPGAFDGDYGEFQYMPRLLGLPHPTGYPLYLLTGWLWSWLPLGTLAYRLNLLSAVWAALTVALLVMATREQRGRLVPALAGAAALALAPFFWRYAGLAAVYTLHTALLAAALWAWLRWARLRREGAAATRTLLVAALLTGLSLTNHPTAAFLVPAALAFVALHARVGARIGARAWLGAALAFALPGLLYLYVPLRLAMIGLGDATRGQHESVMAGLIAPYLQWGMRSVPGYITGRSLLVGYGVEPALLRTDLAPLLAGQVGAPLLAVAALGALLWLIRQPRTAIPLLVLFLPSALYAITYAADFARRNEIAHLEGHILPAMVVLALWIARGVEAPLDVLRRAGGRRWEGVGQVTLAGLVALALWQGASARPMPTEADRVQSAAIERYWREVLAYPIEEGAGLVGHWGDLTAFWYFQHGEGLRPDLRALFPPDPKLIEAWVAASDRPLYLAGPLMAWSPELTQRYRLIPWGIAVRVERLDAPLTLPTMKEASARFDGMIQLEGYRAEWADPQHLRLWLRAQTLAPTPRDLSISLRLHAPDGALLKQYDGRLASLWYPEGILPAGQPLLTAAEIALDAPLPPGTVVRLVIYDPNTGIALLSESGQDVVELGTIP